MERPKQYIFEVEGVGKPISIISYSKEIARKKLLEVLNEMFTDKQNPPKVISEAIEELIVGYSQKKVKDKTFVWTEKGWKELEK